MAENHISDLTTLTVQLLSAFVSKNEVSSEGLAELIKTTRAALTEDLAAPAPAAEPEYAPAVSVRKSLSSPDQILSLIDGKPYKTLKRHLAANGLTEQDYRARYNLPASYPMVAQSYSDMRRAVAEKNGLGKKPAKAAASAPVAAESVSARPAAKAQPAPEKSPAKAAAKKAASKSIATPAIVTPAKVTATESKPAVAAAPRKKLSMFGSKDAKAAPAAQPQVETAAPAAATETPVTKAKAAKAAPKAKGSAKPKSLQSALKAAGAHLGNAADKKESTNS